MILQGINYKRKSDKGFKVAFDTDVNFLAVFELENGHHQALTDNLAVISVGEKIAVGFVVNGKPVRGLIHPEGGHVQITPLPQESSKFNFSGICSYHKNCIEGLCTDVAIAKRLGLNSIEEIGNLGEDHQIWDMIGHYLGTMCANLTLTLSIEKIILCGSVMDTANILYTKIREHFSKQLANYLDHSSLT